MGNSDFRDVATIEDTDWSAISGQTIAIDAHLWLYKRMIPTTQFTATDAHTTSDGESLPTLIATVEGLPLFFQYDITPVFVFDGERPDLKADEVAARREAKEDAAEKQAAAEERGDHVEAAKYEARSQHLTSTMLETTKELFALMDIPVVDAPQEAEAQCAHLAASNPGVDAVGSDDYDTLLYGSPVTLRDLPSQGELERMLYEQTLIQEGLTESQLIDAGILMGTDYNDGLDGYGPATAVSAVQDHEDLWGVLDAENTTIPNAEAIREQFHDPPVSDISERFTAGDAADVQATREFVVEEWEIAESEVTHAFDELEAETAQTGLDKWT